MRKDSIFIITHNQFGYQTDFYNYCKYLLPYYKIQYICLDQGKEKLTLQGISITYIISSKINLLTLLHLIFYIIKTIKKNKPTIVLMKYLPLCSLVNISSGNTKCIMDVRTASVSRNPLLNFINDTILYCEYRLFKHSIVLSRDIKERLFLNRATVIPLGADIIDPSEKNFDNFRLLYVGTLNNRDIEKTIFGLKIFVNKNPKIDIKYTIIGHGNIDACQKIVDAIKINGMDDIIEYRGAIPFNKLYLPFKQNNIGISFIPMTIYYDKQPPTKTYEYLMSGMPVIATKTTANMQIINKTSGMLIDDTPESFAEGLEEIVKNRNNYSSKLIRNMYMENTWKNIVTKKLFPYLIKINESKT